MKSKQLLGHAKTSTATEFGEPSRDALRVSESRYRRLFETAQDGILLLNAETAQIEDVNPYLIQMLGYSHEEFLGKKLWEVGAFTDRAESKEMFAQLQTIGYIRYEDLPLKTKAGAKVEVEFVSNSYECEGIKVIQCNIRNISDRKAAERRIAYLNRLYAQLSAINTLIVRVQGREELFNEACRIGIKQGGFSMSLIAMLDPSAQGIDLVASASKDEKLLLVIKDILSSSEHGEKSLVARMISEKKPFVSNDLENDPGVLSGEKYAQAGVRSVAILPLIISEKAIGMLALFAGESEFFHEEELGLLLELAGDISFALENLDRQQKHANLERIRAVSGEINAAMLRIRARDELFREVCRIAAGAGGFTLAWAADVDTNLMQLRLVGWEGLGQDYVERIPLSLNEADTQNFGLAGRAVREKKAMLVEDLQQDPRIVLRSQARDRGFQSLVALPLLVADAAVGVLVLYANEIGFFDEGEMKLLLELTANISFALDHIEKAKKLEYLAYYDALTGLANRSLFLERVAQYMRSAANGGRRLALFVIDLERFKNINDSLGRPAGDSLLRQVAEWLTRNVGDANLLARVDADHFAMVLPDVKQEGDVTRLLEKTMEALPQHPFQLNDAEFRIAAKIGVALFPDDGANADTLFKNAEAALKKTKASGDRYLFYTQNTDETVTSKLTLEIQLRHALEKGEFVLHYQPKVSVANGKLTSAEALIRWNDPRTGLVPPGRFIPILEETGLIHDVGRWALRQAIEDYLRWRRAGLAVVRLAVNVSPRQLRYRGFIDEIKQVIGIDAHAAAGLELEITETVIMEDIKGSIASLQAIRAMGVAIAIDDFGTGFSSLSYLAKLPVDTLKIDRSFVADMTGTPEGQALVSTIIALAHSLKLKVVAEGVETEGQSRLLRLSDCDEMQGFLFSRAVPADIFEARFLGKLTNFGDIP